MKAKVCVVIPHYNDEERLSKCLNALEQQNFAKDDFIVVVVDNGSTRVPKISKTLTIKTLLLVEPKPGSYSARNKGLAAVECEIYAFTDSDCVPCENWLSSAVKFLEQNKQAAVCGPISLFPRNIHSPNVIELVELTFGFPQLRYLQNNKFAPTANLIVKSTTFEIIGPFNESLLSGGDADWGHRLYCKEMEIGYEPKAAVLHPARHSLKQYLTKTRRVTHGKWKKYKDYNIGNLSFLKTCKYLIPPKQDIKTLFLNNNETPVHKKVLASFFLYLNSLYIFYVITKARLSKSTDMERE
ncbi:hypothetical protein BK026_08390 [Alteromonas sp. V450]|uniref:glycosyltransferase n=1 Tax=Alteromonas sp. V450 TaxID=1912139 RepID=UPI0008FF06D5|nr:glycosyltransferase family A protein [Alteromonas sp. V450]OJF68806.1 hypothetical protein BK026_08390 [Alteromonas sp. V450]